MPSNRCHLSVPSVRQHSIVTSMSVCLPVSLSPQHIAGCINTALLVPFASSNVHIPLGGPDQTLSVSDKSADFVWSRRARSSLCSGIYTYI